VNRACRYWGEQQERQHARLGATLAARLGAALGDGIYDREPVYTTVERHSPGGSVIVPPRKDAVLRPNGVTAPTQRDQHLLAIARTDRFHWKRTSGYDAQAHAENAFSRYKRTFGSRLRTTRGCPTGVFGGCAPEGAALKMAFVLLILRVFATLASTRPRSTVHKRTGRGVGRDT
jgi:hypothetical protein